MQTPSRACVCPLMDGSIHHIPLSYITEWCTSCPTCVKATVRRKHLKTSFDPNSPSATALPRTDYGIDFYGVHKGEIMVTIDLFTSEVKLTFLANRSQDNGLVNKIIFLRGVPSMIRTDNAPELSAVTGAVSSICEYLKIEN